ncbi:MAG: lamin tail domain-containing protein [Bacteroidia bacterium]
MKYFAAICFVFSCFLWQSVHAQIVINEASNRNATQIADEDGAFGDWLELYNAGSTAVNLMDYALTDDSTNFGKWTFPAANLAPNTFQMVHLSGKNRKIVFSSINHWETFVSTNEIWQYQVPTSQPSFTWNQPSFSTTGWLSGKCSIGYGDNDDSTLITPPVYSVYLRHEFTISDTSKLRAAILNIDYDDGFVAYLNGVEVARSGLVGSPPVFDELSQDHEAQMYQGQNPEEYILDWNLLTTVLQNGTNVLAIQCHNLDPNSSDLTIIPYLTFGIKDNTNLGGMTPPPFFTQGSSANANIFHTNFKIQIGGEKVWLIDNSGQMIDNLMISVPEVDHSLGCATDGSATNAYFSTATPNASNNTSTPFANYAATPVFSQNAGFYFNQVNTTITCPDPNAVARYTTNGQIPLITDPVYNVLLAFTQTTALKARCFGSSTLPSRVATNTYFVNDTLYNIPAISITTNNDNLYGGTGIYDNWWTDWKRHCYIEYFDSVGVNQLEQNAGIKIDGGAGGSRSHAQKSFRIEPDQPIFGDSILRYPLIPDAIDATGAIIKRFETFYLRNGSNMHNLIPYKDALMTGLMKGTNVSYSAYHPVAVYLNGEYWGMYELREKQDRGYMRSHYDANKDSLDMLGLSYWYNSTLRVIDGSDSSFYNMMNFFANYPNPASNNFLIEANKRLDLNNYTDYLIAQTFLGNTDWPQNNLKMYRFRDKDKKWKFGLIDVEWGLGVNAWTDVNSDMIGYILDPNRQGHELTTDFWLKLIQNTTYKNFFLNRYADLLNTTFKQNRVMQREWNIFQKFDPNFPRQLTRWGNGGSIQSQMNDYYFYRNGILQDLYNRPPVARDHLRNHFQLIKNTDVTLAVNPPGAGYIKISTLTIPTDSLPWTGIYFDGVPVSVTAVANYGYQFTSWTNNPFISSPQNQGFTANITTNSTNFTANFVAIPTPEEVTVSEVNYQSEMSRDAGDWVEFYNYGTSPIPLNQWYFTDEDSTHIFHFPPNKILNPNEFYVVVRDSAKFMAEHPGITNFIGGMNFGLGDSTDKIKIYNPVNNLVAEFQYTDTLPFPLGANGRGRTLERNNLTTNLNDPANWFDGCIGGSPTQAYSPCTDSLLFSEINYNSWDSLPAMDMGDWVEIRNISQQSIDIGGWTFQNETDGNQYVIPSPRILPPHSNWLLVQDNAKFATAQPTVSNFNSSFLFDLRNQYEWIRLYDNVGKLRLSVIYNDTTPFPTLANGKKYTLEMLDSLGNMNDGNNWFAGCKFGSPGAYYTTPCAAPIAITEANFFQNAPSFLPNPTNGKFEIIFELKQPEKVNISVWDLQGKQLQQLYEGKLSNEKHVISSDISALASGIYLIKFQVGQQKHSYKLIKE